MAQAFDPGALEAKGDPFPVVEQIGIVPNISLGDFSASLEGVLAYGAGAGVLRRLVWVDRSGKPILSHPEPGAYNFTSVSPDGKFVAFTRDEPASGGRDVWVMDVARNTTTRLTFSEQNNAPVWSPGGDQVAYLQTTVDRWRIYRKAANGVGEPILILDKTGFFPMDWSPDGRFLLARATDTSQGTPLGTAVFAVPTSGDPKPIPVIRSKFRISYPRFSPDGRWIAYAASSEGGVRDIFVQAFSPNEPPSVARWQVSSGGGSEPRWRRDGKELFYLSSTGQMMSVGVRTAGAAFQTAPPVPLFDSRLELAEVGGWRYDVSPDGQRFIVAQLVEDVAGAPMNLVVNWLAGARK